MKTNHRRGFTARNDKFRNVPREYEATDEGLGLSVRAFVTSTCYCRGGHGCARNRRGAKSFVHTRLRAKTGDTLLGLKASESVDQVSLGHDKGED